jgi:hypothetical protein
MSPSYLSNQLVEISFQRLSPKSSGKTPLERTSALAYFLAFDAASKRLGKRPLDLNPNKTEGKNCRDAVEIEYAQLVQLHNGKSGGNRQVVILGKIQNGGITAGKRISSNFFTVPLKKASQSSKPYLYPNRPAPVLKMGQQSTGTPWGMEKNEEWETNLPKLLMDLKSNSPFTDLAIFVLRDAEFRNPSDLKKELAEGLKRRFTEELSRFWIKLIGKEGVFFKFSGAPFQASLPAPFSEIKGVDPAGEYPNVDVDSKIFVLEKRVGYLEGLLEANEIEFERT